MRQLWVALVELLTPPTENGDTRCFTHVLFWADSAQDYADRIGHLINEEGMTVVQIESCRPIRNYDAIPENMVRFVDWANAHPDDWLTSDRHYYPSKPA